MVCKNLLNNDVIFINICLSMCYILEKTFTGHYIAVIGIMSLLPSLESPGIKDYRGAPSLARPGKLKFFFKKPLDGLHF